MAIHFAANAGGRPRVRWPAAVALFAALLCTCAVIPAAGFWLAFGDTTLVRTALATGFAIAALSFGAIIGTSLRRPIGQLQTRADHDAGVAAAEVALMRVAKRRNRLRTSVAVSVVCGGAFAGGLLASGAASDQALAGGLLIAVAGSAPAALVSVVRGVGPRS